MRRSLVGVELLARYDVENEIGRGGMATVYRARHKTIHKPVAVKVLDAALDSVADAVDRFLLEAQVTSRIVHENVVEVTDFGTTADGVVFSVMELLHGETLHRLIRSEGRLPPARAVVIARQICAALQAAHDLGIVHRDLKPENCFRTPRTSNPDFIKVLDFGVAKVADSTLDEFDTNADAYPQGRPRSTRVGLVIGTPDYMAPEQAQADPSADHRVDVYAAGAVLFEMLTGRTAYTAPSPGELLTAQIHAPVPDPSVHVAGLPPELCAVVRTAMAKDPADRYPTMASMAKALADAALVAPREAAPRTRWGRLGTLAVGVSLALVGGAWWTQTAPVGPREGESAPSLAAPLDIAPRAPAAVAASLPAGPPPATDADEIASTQGPRERMGSLEVIEEVTDAVAPAAVDVAPASVDVASVAGPVPELEVVELSGSRARTRSKRRAPRRARAPLPTGAPSVADSKAPKSAANNPFKSRHDSGKISEVKNPFAGG